MKAKLSLLVLLMVPYSALSQQTQTDPLREMVETEQAFSKTAEVKSTREAFMQFIADDGLLFRPRAVNGKKWMNEHPVPSSDKRPLLAWQPSFAGMAASGDLGFTTGPWESKEDIKDAKPSGYGHFVTLWKKQPDGTWRFIIDLGISHPQSGGPLTIWKVDSQRSKKSFAPVDIRKGTEVLIQRERTYATAVLKEGLSKALIAFASPEVRVYLPHKLPYIGAQASQDAVANVKEKISYEPIAGEISRSNDLGYVHGTYEKSSREDATKIVERGNYVRIWRKRGDVWQIALDVTNPVP